MEETRQFQAPNCNFHRLWTNTEAAWISIERATHSPLPAQADSLILGKWLLVASLTILNSWVQNKMISATAVILSNQTSPNLPLLRRVFGVQQQLALWLKYKMKTRAARAYFRCLRRIRNKCWVPRNLWRKEASVAEALTSSLVALKCSSLAKTKDRAACRSTKPRVNQMVALRRQTSMQRPLAVKRKIWK